MRIRIWSFLLLVVLVAAGCGESENDGTNQVRVRGVVEGFYGPLYSFAQRRALFSFLARAGLNIYIYGPKLDPYHRNQWRAPYPPDYLAHFRDLAELGRAIGVRFVFAISPAATFDPATDDRAILAAKLRSIFDVGVRDFCLFFDDIATGRPGADPGVQRDLVIDVREFLHGLDPHTTLAFIGTFYAGTAAQFMEDRSPLAPLYTTPSSQYFAAYKQIPRDVPIMWTGPAVFSDTITLTDAGDMHDYVGRPVWVWDNYPVNDVLVMNEMFLGPYTGRDAALGTVLDGIVVNPMVQPEATKIPLWTIGRYFRDGAGYDPTAAWEEALQVVTDGVGTDVVRLIAEQFQSHPFVGEAEESVALASSAAAFWDSRSAATAEPLRALFEQFAAVRDRLESEVRNAALVEELRQPATKLALFGEGGLLALELLAAHDQGIPVDTEPLHATLEAANAIPWLVGANTALSPGLAALVATRPAKPANVFGEFFERVDAELGR